MLAKLNLAAPIMDAPKLLLFIQCCTFLSTTTMIDAFNSECDGAMSSGDDAIFEILENNCKFQRSDVELRLARARFRSEEAATIQITCTKGVQDYTTIIDKVRKDTPFSLNSADVDFDLNGANCSLSGCYPHDVYLTTHKIPDVSCVIDFDDCLPEYCPANVSTCDAATVPPGSYTCTCNQTYRKFNYTTKECDCISGYQESENGTHCEVLDNTEVTSGIKSTMYQSSTFLDAKVNASSKFVLFAETITPIAIILFVWTCYFCN